MSYLKKFWIVQAGAAALAFGYLTISDNLKPLLTDSATPTQLTPAKEQEIILSEAKQKYSLRIPEALKSKPKEVQEQFVEEVLPVVYVEKLVNDAISSSPELLEQAEAKLMENSPRVMQISQDQKGEIFSYSIIVTNTQECAALYNGSENQFTIRVADLFSNFCVHNHMDYRGGFHEDQPISVTIKPIDERYNNSLTAEMWDQLVSDQLRGIVKKQILARVEH